MRSADGRRLLRARVYAPERTSRYPTASARASAGEAAGAEEPSVSGQGRSSFGGVVLRLPAAGRALSVDSVTGRALFADSVISE